MVKNGVMNDPAFLDGLGRQQEALANFGTFLEVDSQDHREFNEHDIVFLTGFANVVAEAVATTERTALMQNAIENMKQLIVEKDQLLGERVDRELKVHELQTELIHVSRLSAVGHITVAIAHELNQPLTAIANYTGAAKRSLDAKVLDSALILRLRDLNDQVQRQTLRAGSIIRNLKDVAEKRESRRFETKIKDVVRESLAMVMYDATDRNVASKLEFDPALLTVLVDKMRIQQILINLIRNSVEAMHDSAERMLTLTTVPGEPGFVNVLVRDTDPGLAHDVLQRLFQPLNTTKKSGMRLTVCQTLAEANGGRIWRLDDQAKGTCFVSVCRWRNRKRTRCSRWRRTQLPAPSFQSTEFFASQPRRLSNVFQTSSPR